MMFGMEAADVDQQLAVGDGSRALGPTASSVIAAGRDLEDPAPSVEPAIGRNDRG